VPPPPNPLGPLARRPAVTLVLLLTAGILLHDQLPSRPSLTLACGTAVTLVAGLCVRRTVVASAVLALAVILGGVALAQREHLAFAADDIGLFATDDDRLATVEATIDAEPQVIANPSEHGRPLPPRQTFLVDIRRVLTTHGWVNATGQLPVRLDQPNPALAAGQTVRLLGMLTRPRPATNPGEFDWAVYYRRLRITATLTVNRPGNARVLAAPGFAPLPWARAKIRHLLAAGFTAAHASDHAVLQAMLLGEHDPDLRDAEADFQQAGVAFQLGVSGLHVVLLAAGVVWVCRRLLVRPRHTLCIGTGFVLLYALVAMPSHSGTRVAIASVVWATGLWFRRTTDHAQLVAVAVLVMLGVHPLDVYAVGFQLSVAVVIAFLIFVPALRRWAVDPDRPWSPPSSSPVSRLRRWLVRAVALGAIAWLATLPLVATDFGQLTPWAVVGGVVLFPVAVIALYAGAAKVVLTLLWPSTAVPAATVAGWPVVAMRAVTHGLTRLPFGNVTLAPPPAWAVVAYYAVLLVPLIPVEPGRRRWVLRLSPLLGIAGLIGASTLATATPSAGGLRVTLLSLGAGQCAVVETPDHHTDVMDCGSSTVPELDRRVVAPFLQASGDRTVTDVFLSHGDFDHISAAGDVAAAFHAAAVFTSHHFRPHAVNNEPDEALLAKLDELGVGPHELAVNDHVDLGGGAAVDVLWPPPDGTWTSNDAGLVLRLTYAGRRILFPADIQDPAFAALLKQSDRLPADVLVAPHHGSSEKLTPAFLAAVHPSIILSSNAARLSAKQRRFDEMVGRTPLYRTPECGAITVTVTPDGRVDVQTYRYQGADVAAGLPNRQRHD
jgi:competence protein ComEC